MARQATALPPSDAPELVDNYRVTRQLPPPGTRLQRKTVQRPFGEHPLIRITPLELWAEAR